LFSVSNRASDSPHKVAHHQLACLAKIQLENDGKRCEILMIRVIQSRPYITGRLAGLIILRGTTVVHPA